MRSEEVLLIRTQLKKNQKESCVFNVLNLIGSDSWLFLFFESGRSVNREYMRTKNMCVIKNCEENSSLK